jgi:DNA-binding transcriptional regulator YhcF (GntR family)
MSIVVQPTGALPPPATGETRSGSPNPGDRLPSIASISQEYGVAMATAQQVIVALREQGLVVTSPMGTFVAEA